MSPAQVSPGGVQLGGHLRAAGAATVRDAAVHRCRIAIPADGGTRLFPVVNISSEVLHFRLYENGCRTLCPSLRDGSKFELYF